MALWALRTLRLRSLLVGPVIHNCTREAPAAWARRKGLVRPGLDESDYAFGSKADIQLVGCDVRF